MPGVIIPRQHQSAPSSRLPKDFNWIIRHKKVPYETAEGIVVPSMSSEVWLIQGTKGGYGLNAGFIMEPWDGYDKFEARMEKAIRGICHDINVVLEGGDAKGKANILLNKLAEKASDEYDVDPNVVKKMLQHQDLQEKQ